MIACSSNPMGIQRKKARPLTARASRAMEEALESRLFLSASQTAQDQALQFLSTSSAVFVQNQGQWPDASIKYAYDGQGINIGFTNTGPVLELQHAAKPAPATDPASVDPLARIQSPPEIDSTRVTVSFAGAQPTAPIGIDQSPTSFNYLVGDASQHRSNVPGYQKIEYPGLYPGIDLLTWAQPTGMKYEFHVAPGADWRNIQVTYSGANGMSLGADGSLHIATPLGDLVEQAPVIYQIVDGKRLAVAVEFVLQDDQTYRFAVTGQYDPSRELVIDPNLAWATFLPGSTTLDAATGVAVGGSGNAYVTGNTVYGGWATPGAYDGTYHPGGLEAFVAEFNQSGTSLLYATYYGGNSTYVHPYAIAVDSLGDAYITGVVSKNGLATAGAYRSTIGGTQDAFVAKFNPTGSSLIYATYLGGAGSDTAYALAIDSTGNALVTGNTNTGEWTTPGAYDTTANGANDIFVAKINASGSQLLYATCLGGGGNDSAAGIAVDTAGNAYITGGTSSSGWATDGAYDTVLSNTSEAFAAKLDPSGSNLIYATYLGFSGFSGGAGIAIDREGNAYVAGATNVDGHATPGSYQETYGGNLDGFVAKINAPGTSLIYATYIGGSNADRCTAIAVDSFGNAYLTGGTLSANFATSGAFDETPNGNVDIFIAKLSPSGSSMLYASYLGGTAMDSAVSIATDTSGNAYIVGTTASPELATPGTYFTQHTASDINWPFVLKFSGIVELFPGDTNGDGQVNFADLVAVAQNYGGANKTRAQGDLTGDGNVDFADLVQVAQNYGTTAAPPPVPAPVITPQPAALPAPLATSPAPLAVEPDQAKPLVSNTVATPSKPKPAAAPIIAPAKAPAIAPKITPAPIQLAPVIKSTTFNSRKRIGDAVWNR
jgi:hypothetical protein